MTLLAPFLTQVESAPDADAIVSKSGEAVSYGNLATWSASLAVRYHAAGIGVGDRVLVLQPVGPALYAVLIAVWRLGAVAVFPEPSAGLSGVLRAAKIAKPKAIAAPSWIRALSHIFEPLRNVPIKLSTASSTHASCDPIVEASDASTALISFTSGSTGAPKPVLRSHGVLLAQHNAIVDCLPSVGGGEVDFMWFPAMALSSLAQGYTVILPDGPLRRPAEAKPARLLAQMHRHGATRIFLPPAICQSIVSGASPSDVREIITGGGPVFPKIVKAIRSWHPSAALHLAYGSTEAEPMAHLNADDISDDDFEAMENGAGLLAGGPVKDTEILLQDGEIWVTGPHVVTDLSPGQKSDETKVDRDGKIFHRTGDSGRIAKDGRLWLLGRWSEGADGFYPFQIEVAASGWPGVRQAAVVNIDGRLILTIAGDQTCLGDWKERVSAIQNVELVCLKRIPLDRRHNSKADYRALRQLARKHAGLQ